ncbi:hypothetical protein BOSP111201_08675 [Bordetella sputigena]
MDIIKSAAFVIGFGAVPAMVDAIGDAMSGKPENSAGRCGNGNTAADAFANYNATEDAGSASFVDQVANGMGIGAKMVADVFIPGATLLAKDARTAIDALVPGDSSTATKGLAIAAFGPGTANLIARLDAVRA